MIKNTGRYRERNRAKNGVFHPASTQMGFYRGLEADGVTEFESFPITLGSDRVSLDVERCWDWVNKPGPPFITGGPFQKIRVQYDPFRVEGNGYRKRMHPTVKGAFWEWRGGFYSPDTSHDNIALSSFVNAGFGKYYDNTLTPEIDPSILSEAYDRIRPQLEKSGLSVALAELRDLPGMLKTSAKGFHDAWKSIAGVKHDPIMRPKRAADHFLNHHFGWVPFLKDLGKMADAFDNSQIYLSQLTRDNDKWVKRFRQLLRTEEENKIYSGGGIGCSPSPFFLDKFYTPQSVGSGLTNGSWDLYDQKNTIIWAMGSFKYYRPEFDANLPGYSSYYQALNRRMTLYGLQVNPSVVWQATPWSWLADWFGNVGKVLDRVNADYLDSVVSRYAYVMQKQIRSLSSRHQIFLSDGTLHLEWRRMAESKQRVVAPTGYGFGLNWEMLSPKQLAILASLGISRGRGPINSLGG